MLSEKDAEYLEITKDFNKYKLYTKGQRIYDLEDVLDYYRPIAEKYLGSGPIYWSSGSGGGCRGFRLTKEGEGAATEGGLLSQLMQLLALIASKLRRFEAFTGFNRLKCITGNLPIGPNFGLIAQR